ncbi:MAG: hypothetical protein WA231_24590 [Methylocella sp.]
MSTRASKRAGRRAPVNKFPAPHFESPASGEEPHHGDRHARHARPAPPGDTFTLTTWRARNILGACPADALGVKQEFEKTLALNGKPTK